MAIASVVGRYNTIVSTHRSRQTSTEGEQEGEQGSARGVPPPLHPLQRPFTTDANTARRAGASFQRQSAPRLTEPVRRAALFAARVHSTMSARRSMTLPWRERPRDLAGSAITSAATAEVAHATLSPSQTEQAIRTCDSAAASAENLRRVSSAVGLYCAVRVRARSRRSALLRPRMRAAGGLDRAIREPLERNYRRPHVNLLTTRADSAILEFSPTVANSQPPPHRPMWSPRIGGPRSRFVLFPRHTPGCSFA